MTKIGIVDLGVSNLGSLEAALGRLSVEVEVLSRFTRSVGADGIILPGVGSFSEAMDRLSKSGLDEFILEVSHLGLPIMGICLGMQLLSERGIEGGQTAGLGLIPGSTLPMSSEETTIRIPHVGWNSVSRQANHSIFEGIPDDADFYFVHSYRVAEVPEPYILGTTHHGIVFCSATMKDNVVGVQFHPEKSQVNGLKLLSNFVRWVPSC